MSAILRPPSFPLCTDNLPFPPTSSPGTALTAGASNADTTVATLISTLTHDVEFIVISFDGFNTSAQAINVAADLLVDYSGAATTWTPIINDLMASSPSTSSTVPFGGKTFMFSLFIPAGASVGMQAKTNKVTDLTGAVLIECFGGSKNRIACGQYVQSIGISGSGGTAHTAGNLAWSSWTNFGSPLERKCIALQFAVSAADGGVSAISYYFEFGVAGSRVLAPLWANSNTSEIWFQGPFQGPGYCELPAGTQLQVRGYASGIPEALGLAVYATM